MEKKIISVINQKGGVGKTTTVMYLFATVPPEVSSKLDEIVKIRNGIWHSYHNQLSKIVRTQTPSESIFISPLAFGLISENSVD